MAFTLAATCGYAQMTIKGIPRVNPSKRADNARIQNTPLTLPFWDDFSTTNNIPSADFWVDSDDVWVNPGMGINPPSLNVATFDGLDVTGKPYSLDQLSDGLTDVLTSCEIDLSALQPSDIVYLSFFYQSRGNGEVPNDNDSLRVEFKDDAGNWIRAWSVTGQDVELDTFKLVALPITDLVYFHSGFQFRFQSFGRQSGPYDIWNIDYVYLNDNVTNFDFPDRALQTNLTSIFEEYQAIPIHHFTQNAGTIVKLPTATAYNLFDLLQPSNFTVIADITSTQTDQSTITETDTLAFEITSSFPDPQGTGIRQIDLNADQLLDPSKVQSDSIAVIDLKLFMNTDDNQPPDYQPEFAPLDFTINDTTYTRQVLHDYYAFDDGSAEFAAGLNFAGDFVAYEFPYFFSGPDTLVSVDMYFPNISGNVGGQSIELYVWQDLEGNPGSTLHSQFVTLQAPDSLNSFTTYELTIPVLVQDTFFVGWRQTNAGSLDIGLDKNNDSGERIFFNLDGTWQQNISVKGSLMLRPRFGKVDIVLGDLPLEESQVKIYPNPNRGEFRISEEISILRVYSMDGREIAYDLMEDSGQQHIIIPNPVPGMYLISYEKNGLLGQRKFIIRN